MKGEESGKNVASLFKARRKRAWAWAWTKAGEVTMLCPSTGNCS